MDAVHSEYGMTELLSQAWSTGAVFQCPLDARDAAEPNDPSRGWAPAAPAASTSSTCATRPAAPSSAPRTWPVLPDGRFEVLGR